MCHGKCRGPAPGNRWASWLNRTVCLFGLAEGYPWEAPSPSDPTPASEGRARAGSVRLGVLRLCSVGFGSRKGAKTNKGYPRSPPAHAAAEIVRPAGFGGSVGFGGVRRPKGGNTRARVRTRAHTHARARMMCVVFFCGSVWLGGARRGLAGFGGTEDARWPGGLEESTHLAVQWRHTKKTDFVV